MGVSGSRKPRPGIKGQIRRKGALRNASDKAKQKFNEQQGISDFNFGVARPARTKPISVPPSRTRRGSGTRREIQLSEGKEGDLFCEIKIIKGKRKRVCKVKTTDKKIKKPIRVSRSVDKQFSFFGRIL